MTAPQNDLEAAAANRLVFSVCRKAVPRGTWLTVLEGLSLEEAMLATRAHLASSSEVGVFVERRTGGFLYWSSLTPELFNSTAVSRRS